MNPVDVNFFHDVLLAALREDIGSGDITSRAAIPAAARAIARYMSKEPIVVAGIDVAKETVRLVDPNIKFKILVPDGEAAPAGAALAEFEGSARSILTAERTSLNMLQRMCGIA